MNKTFINDREKNQKILHHEALKSLCALQYYMSTLNHQGEDLKTINYSLSFKLMTEIVNTIYETVKISKEEPYPPELLMIYDNLKNINIKLNLIKSN